MAFAAPDPKRVLADKQRLRQRELDDLAVFAAERRKKQEIRACYFVGPQQLHGEDVEGYSPKQIRFAGRMLQYDRTAKNLDSATFERIGRSRGGSNRGNLYRCNMALRFAEKPTEGVVA